MSVARELMGWLTRGAGQGRGAGLREPGVGRLRNPHVFRRGRPPARFPKPCPPPPNGGLPSAAGTLPYPTPATALVIRTYWAPFSSCAGGHGRGSPSAGGWYGASSRHMAYKVETIARATVRRAIEGRLPLASSLSY